MAQIRIRNLEDSVIATLKTRARLKGISLEDEVREILNMHRPLTPQEKLVVSREFRARTKGIVPMLAVECRREDIA